MYCTFVMYNGNVYRGERNIFKNKDCIVTRSKEKTDSSFYDYLDYLDRYARDLEKDDIYDLYDVSFCAFYNDPAMPSKIKDKDEEEDEDEDEGEGEREEKGKAGRWWNVNETGTYRLPAEIENDEVSISFYGKDYGIDEDGGKVPEGWTALHTTKFDDFTVNGWIAKTVNIHDCEKLKVIYTYKVFEGQYFFRPHKKIVEVEMTPEEFKAEMLKYRISNI